MKQGDEGNEISFNEETGLVTFMKWNATTKVATMRTLHVSSCAWIETESKDPRDVVDAPKK